MRYIEKQKPPHIYTTWVWGRPIVGGKKQHCSYDDMRYQKKPNVIEAVERSLVEEQKYLCCYTGIQIEIGGFHVEHIKPQTKCIDNEDIEYTNLVAAFPSPNQGCPFGAEAKGAWHEPNLFVSPLDPSCGTRFQYLRDGSIKPIDPNDRAAKKTIEKLKLDHSVLNGLRRRAIQEFKRLAPQLGIHKLRKIASSYSEGEGVERLPEFCFVIQQMAKKELSKKVDISKSHIADNLKRKRRK